MTPQHIILSALLLLFCGCCLYDFLTEYSKGRTEHRVPAWDTSAVNFGLFIWLMFATLFFSQHIGLLLLSQLTTTDQQWLTLLPAAIMHLSLIAVLLIGAKRFPSLSSLVTERNSATPDRRSAWYGLFFFAAGLPIVWLTNLAWNGAQMIWEKLGIPVDTSPQELVLLMQQSDQLVLYLLVGFIAVFLAPVSEELIFRAGIYRFLKHRLSPLLALIISALLFSALHFNVNSFLPLFTLGLLFGRAYERTGNILVPILFHALFNLNTVLLVRFIPDSEIEIDPFGVLFGLFF